jgi:ssDNA-binding Zn-finger/Zn-ribbon topoisomerase 1
MQNKTCRYCGVGVLKRKQGRYGAFLGCDQFPRCAGTERLPKDIGDRYYTNEPLGRANSHRGDKLLTTDQ